MHWRYVREQAKNNNVEIESSYNACASLLRDAVDRKGDLIRNINKKVKSICCDDKDFQIDFLDIEQPYKSAFVAKQENKKLLLPENLGSGFNILVAYALFSHVAEQEKVPIVLIIDEPELHLHSDWQRKMYDTLTEQTSLQIIYATQSENFVSLKHWQQILLINESGIYPQEETLNETIDTAPGQSASRRDFLDDIALRNLNVSTILRENLELFFTKKCILVEGPGDKYALPKLLKLFGCDIEDFSVSIIPAWGKTKIKSYQMVCKCFGIEYFTVFDHDNEETENYTIKSGSLDRKFTEFSDSFEKRFGIMNNDGKFQKLVKKVDELSDINLIDAEIKSCAEALKVFIES